MARRTGRSDMPTDPAGAMRAMGVCRGAMIDVLRTVKPMGPAYHGASMVITAIDAFAQFITGQRHYFSADGSCPTDTRRRASEPPPKDT